MDPRRDPRDWASDRKAATEHARNLKDRQKEDEEYTFHPQVNRRPKFLDKRVDSEIAALQYRMRSDDV